jgi:hypothetical protein
MFRIKFGVKVALPPSVVYKMEPVSSKSPRIAALIQRFAGQSLDPHYLGFFACFNQGAYFEAHEVLEDLWLADRHGPNGAFYKGLIQLAGAFVHVQKGRPGPARALLCLAKGNLGQYPAVHEQLDVGLVIGLIEDWGERLRGVAPSSSLPGAFESPKLRLLPSPACRGRNNC